jgi:small subunit ribosomal protein S20
MTGSESPQGVGGLLANSRSAEKRVRQERKRTLRNKVQRSRLKTLIKKVAQAEEPEAATAAFRQGAALLDRLATRRIIHPNKARRKKSQLARRVKELGGTP